MAHYRVPHNLINFIFEFQPPNSCIKLTYAFYMPETSGKRQKEMAQTISF